MLKIDETHVQQAVQLLNILTTGINRNSFVTFLSGHIMNKTFSLLALIKKSKMIVNGTVPIYLRITIDGKTTEIAAKRYIFPEKWNHTTQKVNGNSEDARAINNYLKTLEQQVYELYHQIMKDKVIITAENLKQRLQGTEERSRTLSHLVWIDAMHKFEC